MNIFHVKSINRLARILRSVYRPIRNRKNLKFIDSEVLKRFDNLHRMELKNSLIKPEIFLITKNYLGIPMYVSVKNKHISFEHTHPPHEYILSKNKFKKISELKNKINEIVN